MQRITYVAPDGVLTTASLPSKRQKQQLRKSHNQSRCNINSILIHLMSTALAKLISHHYEHEITFFTLSRRATYSLTDMLLQGGAFEVQV